MYRIGLFSKISKTTVKTLRYYDDIGLLQPAYTDETNGYRFYTTDQLVQLHHIVALRQMGFSIEDILHVKDGDKLGQILARKEAELEAEIKAAADKLSRIKNFKNQQERGFSMSYQAVIKELPECIVYSKKMRVPNYDAYFELVPKIGEEVTAANPSLKLAQPEYSFIVYLDGEYKEKDFEVEFCEAVESFGTDTDTITFKKIDSVQAVTVLHKGPYNHLGEAYAYVFKWIEDNGYTATGHPRESYIDGIWNKDSKEDWLTELQVPVEKPSK
ncbi:MerR family transcriptional regulator [Salipaludibacillus aurantiacus]|uniref:DNA-binding transcriptional regulator, MerR family n=1 Tax=Salipaludibacillus aurantiacus TaxID=1601833 RepID=A0A1H9UPW7_9BACI|nr:MerR family transcriptional regulator [Salipaludibacillus aurantiacus]SES11053.1 DNA-binding transcriptional regulator, MerR family [Salipaludibacillus aurantiacus]